jgi:cyclopropane fatty-acyl-phospholipid synthase-like methyltransferase
MMKKRDWDNFWSNSQFPAITKAGFDREKNAIRKVFKELKLDKNIKIIDFGCGEGRTLSYIKEFGFKNSIGVDTSKEALINCSKKGFQINHDVFHIKDDKNFKMKCDLLFSEGMLEHYKNWNSIVKKMTNASKKYIFLVQPITKSLTFRTIDFFVRNFGEFRDYVKEYHYTLNDYIKAFKKYGFVKKIVQTTHNFPIFLDTSIIIVLERA